MKKYKIVFSYDGSNFLGYQRQKNLRTVQGEIEKVLTKLANQEVLITSSGRTDRLVHALNQVASFNLKINVNEQKIKQAMNTYLPDDIYIKTVEEVDEKFHPRYMAKEKTYQYLISQNEYDPLQRNYVYQYQKNLNLELIKEASQYLIGTHDYRSFVSENKIKEDCVRTITKIKIKNQKGIIKITFTGDGFLKYQVRNMVGALIKVGEEKLTPLDIAEILENKNRNTAPKMAPGEGLYLVSVKY